MKTNYYEEQLLNAIKDHDLNYPLQVKVNGTKNESKWITLPEELFDIMVDWYKEKGYNY